MTKPKFVVVLLLSIVLASCSPTLATPDSQPAPTPTLTQTPPVPAITMSLNTTADGYNPENIIDLTYTTFESETEEGFLVIFGSRTYYLYDIKNKKIVDIDEDQEVIVSDVSPNRKLMLYGTCRNDKCDYTLRSVDKITKANISTEADWIPARWLDNEHVIFLHTLQPKDQFVLPQDLVVCNLFTDNVTTVRLDDLPNPTTEHDDPRNFIHSSLAPSLKQVFFNDQDDKLVLWDFDTQKKIASLPNANKVYPDDTDSWSSDGEKFVATSPDEFQTSPEGFLNSPNELFMFDMDGNITQLTHYNQQFQYASIIRPVWSPDNRHIAFWLRISNDDSNKWILPQWLAVFDITTLETRIYRLKFSDNWPARSQIWSPDGQQLIINNGNNNILVDLAHETQSIIPDLQEMFVTNWMVP